MSKSKRSSMGLAEQARLAMQGVVQIHVEGYVEDEIRSVLNPSILYPANWSGSGFFVEVPTKEEGYILTNAHVARNAKNIEIMSMLTSEERFNVELVGIVKNLEPDIALLKLPSDELARFKEIALKPIRPLKLSTESNFKRGAEVKAIGYPLQMIEPNMSGGEITNFISGSRYTSEKIVTDAAINPGNSGGPAIIEDGTVVGINTAIIENAENIGFITPSYFASIILKNLIDKNEPRFSGLGGDLQKNCAALAAYFQQEIPKGVVVCEIDSGGMLESAGLKREDVILSIRNVHFDRHGIVMGTDVYRHKNIYDVIRLIPLGESVEITYLREGNVSTTQVKAVVDPSKGVESSPVLMERRYLKVFGMIIQELNFEIIESLESIDVDFQIELLKRVRHLTKSLVVTHFDKGGQGDQMEWLIGEIIDCVDGVEVNSLAQLQELINSAIKHEKQNVKIVGASGRIGYYNLTGVSPLEILSGDKTS